MAIALISALEVFKIFRGNKRTLWKANDYINQHIIREWKSFSLREFFVLVAIVVSERRNIRENGRTRGISTGTFANEHLLFRKCAFYQNGIVFITNRSQHVIERNELRSH